jgi:2-amino-4-hydroxy-6-hydroxymethyldihydropteridine diphosphokinase
MILIALGSNLSGAAGSPLQNCKEAIAALERHGVHVVKRSSWYRTPPWPPSDQPWYVNGAIAVETALDPASLLGVMHEVERGLGRVRDGVAVNAARAIDLDLLDYHGQVRSEPPPVLPHPRLADRAFVLRPLADIAPDWRHPETGRSLRDLLAALPADAIVEPLESPTKSAGSGA